MKPEFNVKNLLVPLVILLDYPGLGLRCTISPGYLQPLIMFGSFGLALGVGLGCKEMLKERS